MLLLFCMNSEESVVNPLLTDGLALRLWFSFPAFREGINFGAYLDFLNSSKRLSKYFGE